jgi:UDP-glucose 4-epimerase
MAQQMSDKLLILGGDGFIGGHVADEALKRGLDVTVFDQRRQGRRTDIGAILGDIRDPDAVRDAVMISDYAINLAAILGTQETIRTAAHCVAVNIGGTLNFLEACVPSGFHRVRGVQIGIGNYWMNSPYPITKRAAVSFVRMFNAELGTRVAMVRGMHAYGERQKHLPVRKIVPTFIVQALRGEPLSVYGDGEQVVDMIYVRDLANVLLDACISPSAEYDCVYEAGLGRPLTVNDVAREIIRAADSSSRIDHLPMRPGEEPNSVVGADPGTLVRLGNYNFVQFEDGIQRVVDWYRTNYAWGRTE